MIRPHVILGVTTFIAWACTAAAQSALEPRPPLPPRDNLAAPATGTGGIRGRVVDAENGAALRNTQLRLSGGGLRESPTVGTDDEGRFEFESLPAGRYTLTAQKPGYMTIAYGQRRAFESGRPIELADKQRLEGIDFAVPRGGVIAAHIVDENGEPLSDVRVIAQRYRFAGGQRALAQASPVYQGTDDRGDLRIFGLPPGDYYVSATSSMGPSGGGGGAQNGKSYVPTYFPGTVSVDTAQRVSVQVGREVAVSFALASARVGRISGTVRRADGSPAVRTTSVSVSGRTPGTFSRGAQVRPDGNFTVNEIPPGDYSVQATFGGPTSADREQGRVSIAFTGADVTGVVVPMLTGGSIRGRVTFDAERPANVQVSSIQPYVTSRGTFVGEAPRVQTDGVFVIAGVFDPGFVRVQTLPPGWFLKAVTLGGKDVTDTPLAVDSGGELTGVEVVLTQTRAEINGSAADDKGAAINDYAVVVFPDDRSQWTATSRFIFTARPDQQGRFKVTGLPSGKYLAAALDYIEPGSERDPELLDRLRSHATPVSVDDGEVKTVTLGMSAP